MGSTLGSLSYHETVALEVVMIGSSASANGYEIYFFPWLFMLFCRSLGRGSTSLKLTCSISNEIFCWLDSPFTACYTGCNFSHASFPCKLEPLLRQVAF